MKHLAFSAALFVSVGVATSETTMHRHSSATEVIDLLSGIDFLPGASQIGDRIATLGDIANDDTEPPGVRIRAYRSLGNVDDPTARAALQQGIDRYRNATTGTELLFLIAAAEGLGEIAGPTDVPTLGPLLDSVSRDLRAVVARALGHVGDPAACNLLRRRLQVEQSEQVEIAIDEALAVCP